MPRQAQSREVKEDPKEKDARDEREANVKMLLRRERKEKRVRGSLVRAAIAAWPPVRMAATGNPIIVLTIDAEDTVNRSNILRVYSRL